MSFTARDRDRIKRLVEETGVSRGINRRQLLERLARAEKYLRRYAPHVWADYERERG